MAYAPRISVIAIVRHLQGELTFIKIMPSKVLAMVWQFSMMPITKSNFILVIRKSKADASVVIQQFIIIIMTFELGCVIVIIIIEFKEEVDLQLGSSFITHSFIQ